MKTPVSNELVAQYAAKVRAGDSTKDLFPARMSDCDFTSGQRDVIRQARADRKATSKQGQARAEPPANTKPPTKPPSAPIAGPATHLAKALSKLKKMLYLQGGRCFFCGEPLRQEEASIEHLNPKSRGGTNAEDNEVVCHKSLNQVFGAMGLKTKFEFVLKSAGQFKCPKP